MNITTVTLLSLFSLSLFWGQARAQDNANPLPSPTPPSSVAAPDASPLSLPIPVNFLASKFKLWGLEYETDGTIVTINDTRGILVWSGAIDSIEGFTVSASGIHGTLRDATNKLLWSGPIKVPNIIVEMKDNNPANSYHVLSVKNTDGKILWTGEVPANIGNPRFHNRTCQICDEDNQILWSSAYNTAGMIMMSQGSSKFYLGEANDGTTGECSGGGLEILDNQETEAMFLTLTAGSVIFSVQPCMAIMKDSNDQTLWTGTTKTLNVTAKSFAWPTSSVEKQNSLWVPWIIPDAVKSFSTVYYDLQGNRLWSQRIGLGGDLGFGN